MKEVWLFICTISSLIHTLRMRLFHNLYMENSSYFLRSRTDLFWTLCNKALFAAFTTFTVYISENLLSSSEVSLLSTHIHTLHFLIVWLQVQQVIESPYTSADLALFSADALLAQGSSCSSSVAAGELDRSFTLTKGCLQFKLNYRSLYWSAFFP